MLFYFQSFLPHFIFNFECQIANNNSVIYWVCLDPSFGEIIFNHLSSFSFPLVVSYKVNANNEDLLNPSRYARLSLIQSLHKLLIDNAKLKKESAFAKIHHFSLIFEQVYWLKFSPASCISVLVICCNQLYMIALWSFLLNLLT